MATCKLGATDEQLMIAIALNTSIIDLLNEGWQPVNCS